MPIKAVLYLYLCLNNLLQNWPEVMSPLLTQNHVKLSRTYVYLFDTSVNLKPQTIIHRLRNKLFEKSNVMHQKMFPQFK